MKNRKLKYFSFLCLSIIIYDVCIQDYCFELCESPLQEASLPFYNNISITVAIAISIKTLIVVSIFMHRNLNLDFLHL